MDVVIYHFQQSKICLDVTASSDQRNFAVFEKFIQIWRGIMSTTLAKYLPENNWEQIENAARKHSEMTVKNGSVS